MPLSPPLVLKVGSVLRIPHISVTRVTYPQLGLTRDLGARHVVSELRLSSVHFLGVSDGTQEESEASLRDHVGRTQQRLSSPAIINWGGGTNNPGGPR
jgi:hypothetical protein